MYVSLKYVYISDVRSAMLSHFLCFGWRCCFEMDNFHNDVSVYIKSVFAKMMDRISPCVTTIILPMPNKFAFARESIIVAVSTIDRHIFMRVWQEVG